MLLNISNHPSAGWPAAQREAAVARFGAVADLPHPSVDPAAGTADITALARQTLQAVLDHPGQPHAVHVMGEQSFCYALIQLLQAHGLPVFCSTTRRIAETLDNGDIRRGFTFVQFREYSLLRSA